ncbi:putative Cyclin [Blattamonas nauphoetae]|uniref:Cyclin n=1 Tax=Blattamonas nauphoetae TaxID=2049346 RepID=A0ABQ9Y1K1_9EUKA|nr:putative Cyclin [Blattamonas nauphoetae]
MYSGPQSALSLSERLTDNVKPFHPTNRRVNPFLNLDSAEIFAAVKIYVIEHVSDNDSNFQNLDVFSTNMIFCLNRTLPSLPDYLDILISQMNCSPLCFIVALIYITRLERSGSVILTSQSAHALLLTSIVITAKYLDDLFYFNTYYAHIGRIDFQELNQMELQFLSLMSYSLGVSPSSCENFYINMQNIINPLSPDTYKLQESRVLSPITQTSWKTSQQMPSKRLNALSKGFVPAHRREEEERKQRQTMEQRESFRMRAEDRNVLASDKFYSFVDFPSLRLSWELEKTHRTQLPPISQLKPKQCFFGPASAPPAQYCIRVAQNPNLVELLSYDSSDTKQPISAIQVQLATPTPSLPNINVDLRQPVHFNPPRLVEGHSVDRSQSDLVSTQRREPPHLTISPITSIGRSSPQITLIHSSPPPSLTIPYSDTTQSSHPRQISLYPTPSLVSIPTNDISREGRDSKRNAPLIANPPVAEAVVILEGNCAQSLLEKDDETKDTNKRRTESDRIENRLKEEMQRLREEEEQRISRISSERNGKKTNSSLPEWREQMDTVLKLNQDRPTEPAINDETEEERRYRLAKKRAKKLKIRKKLETFPYPSYPPQHSIVPKQTPLLPSPPVSPCPPLVSTPSTPQTVSLSPITSQQPQSLQHSPKTTKVFMIPVHDPPPITLHPARYPGISADLNKTSSFQDKQNESSSPISIEPQPVSLESAQPNSPPILSPTHQTDLRKSNSVSPSDIKLNFGERRFEVPTEGRARQIGRYGRIQIISTETPKTQHSRPSPPHPSSATSHDRHHHSHTHAKYGKHLNPTSNPHPLKGTGLLPAPVILPPSLDSVGVISPKHTLAQSNARSVASVLSGKDQTRSSVEVPHPNDTVDRAVTLTLTTKQKNEEVHLSPNQPDDHSPLSRPPSSHPVDNLGPLLHAPPTVKSIIPQSSVAASEPLCATPNVDASFRKGTIEKEKRENQRGDFRSISVGD